MKGTCVLYNLEMRCDQPSSRARHVRHVHLFLSSLLMLLFVKSFMDSPPCAHIPAPRRTLTINFPVPDHTAPPRPASVHLVHPWMVDNVALLK